MMRKATALCAKDCLFLNKVVIIADQTAFLPHCMCQAFAGAGAHSQPDSNMQVRHQHSMGQHLSS
jgi:hypothetical protein